MYHRLDQMENAFLISVMTTSIQLLLGAFGLTPSTALSFVLLVEPWWLGCTDVEYNWKAVKLKNCVACVSGVGKTLK